MKFLMEFFTCCGPRQPGSSRPADDKRLLVAQEPRRSMIEKLEGVAEGGGGYHNEWKPSLLSISEDDVYTEVSGDDIRQAEAERGRSLKRQFSSSSPRRSSRSRSCSNSHVGRTPVSTVVRPTLVSSRSFMF